MSRAGKSCENCGQFKTLHAGHEHRGACPDESGNNYRYAGKERALKAASLPGGGPWRISPDCACRLHNTLYAAYGRRSDSRCICPRALHLLKEWEAAHNARRRVVRASDEKRAERNLEKIQSMRPAKMIRQPEEHTGRAPDLSGGSCTQPWAKKYVEGGFNTLASQRGIEDRAAAAMVCEHCPIKQTCLDWVRAAESPPGSWGGVWGGLDPWERMGKRIVERGGVVKVVDIGVKI